ncbi:expressed unknown protein [Seminavis robusta]|uniref:Uncharacterized protein n=1 Tax=Seminavis robusta TaxID=568900 RepID=A0A9N8DQ78_9STRA|nr:expressed unknown protein [Seminavis robusta]|eukprot:Sro293_g110020.1 n/a (408) ;mRNA; r:60850-62073
MNSTNITNTLFSVENILSDHGESVNPTFALVGSALALVIGSVALLASWPSCRILVVPLFLFVVACSLFVWYSYSLRKLDNADYQGLVRVIDVTYDKRVEVVVQNNNNNNNNNNNQQQSYNHVPYNSNKQERKVTYTWHYDAVVSVDWGYEWACSAHLDGSGQPKQCFSIVPLCSQRICSRTGNSGRRSCTYESEQRALNDVRECMAKRFNGTRIHSITDSYTPFDPFVGPSQDVDWPSIIAYGDCDTCEIHVDLASAETLRRIRTAGFVFLFVSLAMLAALLLVALCNTLDCERRKRQFPRKRKDSSARAPSNKHKWVAKPGVDNIVADPWGFPEITALPAGKDEENPPQPKVPNEETEIVVEPEEGGEQEEGTGVPKHDHFDKDAEDEDKDAEDEDLEGFRSCREW